MNIDSPEVQSFMLELCRMTDGDIARQVPMYDVGAAVGMDKNEASGLSEELIIDGLVELKTLAGGIGITPDGLELLQSSGLIAGPVGGGSTPLSGNPVLTTNDIEQVVTILTDIKQMTFKEPTSYQNLEELVMDVKTLEMQLLSPKPKTSIVREVLLSMKATLTTSAPKDIVTTIKGLLGK